ncbi:hypothetical protein ACFSVJ_28250 [Prauserella oleivorans]
MTDAVMLVGAPIVLRSTALSGSSAHVVSSRTSRCCTAQPSTWTTTTSDARSTSPLVSAGSL